MTPTDTQVGDQWGEPVAWLTTGGDVTRSHAYAVEQSVNAPENYPVALYAHPPTSYEGEGLREVIAKAVFWSVDDLYYAPHDPDCLKVVDAILQALQSASGK